MTDLQKILTIAVVALTTILTRAIAFIAFPAGRKTPSYVRYLGRTLPSAALGMLVIYCLKDVSVLAAPHGLPELIALAALVALHVWKKNMFLSIAVPTVIYVLLVNFVFVAR